MGVALDRGSWPGGRTVSTVNTQRWRLARPLWVDAITTDRPAALRSEFAALAAAA